MTHDERDLLILVARAVASGPPTAWLKGELLRLSAAVERAGNMASAGK